MRLGRAHLLPALALAAGAVDASTYLGIGHAFPANMTGNTVLLAIGIGRGGGTEAARAAVALGGFAAGVLGGVALERADRPWPASSLRPLAAQTICLAVVGLTWWLAGLPTSAVRLVLLAIAGGAMGLQSSTTRAAHVSGVATSYVTGTLTNALVSLAERGEHRAEQRGGLAGTVWLLYAAGALAGALLERAAGAGAFILPSAILAVMTAAALGGRAGWRARPRRTPATSPESRGSSDRSRLGE